jgi:hypothetical protein
MRRRVQATAHGRPDLKIKVERAVNSWKEIAENVEQYEGPRWIFRGVPDKTFDLIPKIARPGTRKSRQDGRYLPYEIDEEDKMFKEFERIARPYFRTLHWRRPEPERNRLPSTRLLTFPC